MSTSTGRLPALLLVAGGVAAVSAIAALSYALVSRMRGRAAPPATPMEAPKEAGAQPKGPTSASKRRPQGAKKRTPSTKAAAHGAAKGDLGEAAAMQAVVAQCDESLDDILKLSLEAKQRVFYALLMRGEMLMGSKKVQDIKQCIDYFCKAVSLVPNPGEVLAAFENTLPPPIFALLIAQMQSKVEARIQDYFARLSREASGLADGAVGLTVAFLPMVEREPGSEQERRTYVPTAAAAIQAGSVVWEEAADVACLSLAAPAGSACEHCFAALAEGSLVECALCRAASYCSNECRLKALDAFHVFACNDLLSDRDEGAIARLRGVCGEASAEVPLLVLRYVALLLREELAGNGSNNRGPFEHYDHLRPHFGAPTEGDRAEAKLLRALFGRANENVVEFLSDDIYTSIKYTLARNTIKTLRATPDGDCSPALCRAESRQVRASDGDAPDIVAFFHIAAHLRHSCTPNTVLSLDGRRLTVRAARDIAKDEPLTMSYLQVGGAPTAERQAHLMRVFGIYCQCHACQQSPIVST